jgi:A118 family predicted phage portal protein
LSVIGDFFKSVWKGVRRLLPTKEIEKQLKIKTVISGTMQNGIMLWSQMYSNTPPWVKGKVKGLNLPATISSEFARLILIEWEFEVTGSPMAEYINEQMKQIMKRKNLLKYVEWWVALGGIAFKPYMREDMTIGIDIQQADDFYPVAFDSNGEVSAAVFVETLKKGEYLYTRLEYHQMLKDDYVVINKAFRSNEIDNISDDDMGQVRNRYEKEVPLDSVDEWAGLDPEVHLGNIFHPLFSYIGVPLANNVDKDSPLGASVFHRAVETIQEADEQWGRTWTEYRRKQTKIFADESILQHDSHGRLVLDDDEGVYEIFDSDNKEKPILEPFSPEIRYEPMFKGLNEALMQIENQVGLAYGTISKPTDIEKTAEEIKMSKQRSFTTVQTMQESLLDGLTSLVDAIHAYALLYKIVPDGNVEVSCTWGDGVLEDTEKEYQRRLNLCMSGHYKWEKLLAWYFGCSEEEALEMMPQSTAPPDVEEEE